MGGLRKGKVVMKRVDPGDAVTLRAGGGGGFGPPGERDPEKVAQDVRQGYVSRGAAEKIYRIALDERGRVDSAATRQLRPAASSAQDAENPAATAASARPF